MATPGRFLFLLVILLQLVACAPEPCSTVNEKDPNTKALRLAGKVAQLRIFSRIEIPCDAPIPTPSSVSVEVSDPDNLPVVHQSALNTNPLASAMVDFTPTKVGRYHVLAAFEPFGGIHQVELQTVRDRTAEVAPFTYKQECASMERTRKGFWACDSDLTAGDGKLLLRSFPGGRLAVVGDVVWMVDGAEIHRYEHRDEGLVQNATLEHVQGVAEFLLATEQELVVLHASTLQRISFSGEQLVSTGLTPWVQSLSPFSQGGPRGFLLRAGERLGLVTRFEPGRGQPPMNQVCPYRLEGGRFVRTTEDCQQFSGVVVGFDPSGVWIGDPRSAFVETDFFDGLRWMEWTSTGLVEQASLVLSTDLKLINHPVGQRQSVVPVLNHRFLLADESLASVPTYDPEHRTIVLEHLAKELDEPRVSTSLLWGTPKTGAPAGSSSVSVYLRPTDD